MDDRSNYHALVCFGRFQPFHNGHLNIVHQGLDQCEHLFLVCGGIHEPRSIASPWSLTQRAGMIRSVLGSELNKRVTICGLDDVLYDDRRWAANAYRLVKTEVASTGNARIGLVGCAYERGYPALFPRWPHVGIEKTAGTDPARIRAALFEQNANDSDRYLSAVLPGPVLKACQAFRATAEYALLRDEFKAVAAFKSEWAAAPYPPVFVTVDAVVVVAGHVLLIRRGRQPGKGLWALPGGFLGPDESLRDACRRELLEETGLDLPAEAILGKPLVFDAPNRSVRGRIITHVFLFEPVVHGGDDAAEARWFALANLDRGRLFEDHYAILQRILGLP
jgi:bifunctional NMN adenylyltransferase/nudix hydrolase